MPFEIVRNDITRMKVDAIVNAANSSLLGGGGVDGAIHAAAGPGLREECRTLGGCRTGEAKITGGYRLPARYVIHTVGPVWRGGSFGEEEQLRSCYRNALQLALSRGCESVAFPLISAGAYGYPQAQAMNVAADTIRSFLRVNEMQVYLVLFGRTEFLTGKKLYRDLRAYIDDVYAEKRTNSRMERLRGRLWRRDPKAALDLDLELSGLTEKEDREAEGGPPAQTTADSAPFPAGADDTVCQATEAPYEGPTSAPSARPAPKSAGPLPKAAARPEIRPDGAARDWRNDTWAWDSVPAGAGEPDWNEILRHTDAGFSESLLRLIERKGMTDAQCYKLANVDRKLFSKIRSNPEYRPSKPTVFAFAVALRLNLRETEDLLRKAGFALTRSSRFDIAMEYFIRHRIFDIYEINEVLFQFDMPLLGSGMG